MKRLFLFTSIALGSLLFSQQLLAQETARERIARKQMQQQKESLPELTVRAANMNDDQTQVIENAPWMREIYRLIDLRKEKNASLYYPVAPIGDKMNLFSMIFNLMAKGDIQAYEFLDGREIFTDEYKVNFKDLLDRFSIMYTEENGKFVINESDVPSNEILGYFVKEAWYFDKSNSVVDTKILAICPVMFRQDDFDAESTRYPLFWLPYESIRPYAARMPIMTSNLNNAENQTVDDYFRKRMFVGDIYKTTNMKNLALAQMFPTDTLVKKEQKKIEAELKQFKDNLWVWSNDSIQQAQQGAKTKSPKATKATAPKADKTTAPSEKKSSTDQKVRTNEPKSSTPTRSMRNRRAK